MSRTYSRRIVKFDADRFSYELFDFLSDRIVLQADRFLVRFSKIEV